MTKSQGHYANLRNRFLQNDIDGFLDYEVIELLLKLADNRRDQKTTAKRQNKTRTLKLCPKCESAKHEFITGKSS